MTLTERGPAQSFFILVMGVSGSGKTSVSQHIAVHLDGVFIEADDYHPKSNIELMASGRPLDSSHRWPWLKAIADAALKAAANNPGPVVIACSALRRAYRDRLREMLSPMLTVHLSGSKELIERRLASRRAHFMPASLLESQFATVEALGADEEGFEVAIDRPLKHVVEDLVARLSGTRGRAPMGEGGRHG